MSRADTINPTKLKIIKTAIPLFFKDGYTNTTARKIAQTVGISTGNLTFHFPTKEHLLLELTKAFCKYQWEMTLNFPKHSVTPLHAYGLEIAVQTAVCDKSDIARDFYISAYTQPMTLEEIRKNDSKKAQMLFRDFNPDWTEHDFREAENIASGIELSAMMTETDEEFTIESKVSSTLDALMKLYNVPEDTRLQAIEGIKNSDYIEISQKILPDFSKNIERYINL